MRSVLKALIVLAAAAIAWMPMPAQAEPYFSPFIGTNFDNASGNGRINFGFNVGAMGGGIAGGELDFGYAPSFFGNKGDFGSNYVMDLMGNLIIGVPVGGTYGPGVRPYATIGFGLLRSQITGIAGRNVVEVANNDPGINAGAGVMGFLSDHVGLRGDVRYFRDVHSNATANGIDFGSFHYWRASFGVVLR